MKHFSLLLLFLVFPLRVFSQEDTSLAVFPNLSMTKESDTIEGYGMSLTRKLNDTFDVYLSYEIDHTNSVPITVRNADFESPQNTKSSLTRYFSSTQTSKIELDTEINTLLAGIRWHPQNSHWSIFTAVGPSKIDLEAKVPGSSSKHADTLKTWRTGVEWPIFQSETYFSSIALFITLWDRPLKPLLNLTGFKDANGAPLGLVDEIINLNSVGIQVKFGIKF